MSRRKGEIIGKMNERDFPDIVELALPSGGFGKRTWEFEAFHVERGMPVRPGRGRNEGEQFYVRFCFPDAATAKAFHARFGGECLSYAPRLVSSRPKKPSYQPRIFAGRVVTPDELERIHKEILEYERIEAISDEMRELIEQIWPELVHKLPPKQPR